jgi:hypothetical protein
MPWTAFHRRGEVLRSVVETVDARRDGRLPMALPGGAETFRDELDLLAALHLRWHTRLSGNLELALMDQPVDLPAAVVAAWRRTAEELAGLRLVMDRYAAHPVDADMAAALTRAREKEWTALALAAGLASDEGPHAAAAGRGLEDRARTPEAAGEPHSPVTEPASPAARTADEPDSPSLVDRIKAVLAA